ncbi:MAG: pentapeptide repeat-containing protein [Desulfuromonadaceae bacterium]|nr:pentapeptide repeat-containing protein [Desulfuromonadaceae bacterium]
MGINRLRNFLKSTAVYSRTHLLLLNITIINHLKKEFAMKQLLIAAALITITGTTLLPGRAAAANQEHVERLLKKNACVNCDLLGANLHGANLRAADLRGADLRGANLRGADLSWAYLSEAKLSGANLREADLSWADLRGANLNWANLSGANLNGAYLNGAYLSETMWTDGRLCKSGSIGMCK